MSQWIGTAGVILNLVGVLILFRFGMPFRVRTGGLQMLAWGEDDDAKRLEDRYSFLGWAGLAFVVIGAACQLWLTWNP